MGNSERSEQKIAFLLLSNIMEIVNNKRKGYTIKYNTI